MTHASQRPPGRSDNGHFEKPTAHQPSGDAPAVSDAQGHEAGLVAVPLVELQNLIDLAAKQRWLTVKGAAEYASLSEDSIRRMLEEEALTPYRPRRGTVLIDRRQLDRYILSATGKPQGGRGRHRRHA